ncbi:hypothetical protein K9857_08700 [Pseudomonas sp. REP124]|uniref:hypothetical protein n=1 Tax=Pseudomonas sp. REP124 TaxID=2875731 RepID=UPI001CCFDF4C|nr:hypothetical protein [Pseudomonas sp. REP124]MBZ9781629.1 hypothetical protein [Pseudomonas sp. REP124]
MKWNFDWKYLLGIAIAIAALALPAYQWQSDLNAHSLSVRKLSSSPLQPFANSKTYDVKMTVNGVELTNPYFNSFEIVNSGSKPILSTDFETPIEFTGASGLQFVSARLDLTEPKEIPVKISVDNSRLSVAPYLSNPKDKIVFSTITSGPDPLITVKARIAGIREVSIEDSSVEHVDIARLIISAVQCLVSLTIYFTYAWIIPRQRKHQSARTLDWRFLLASALCCGLGASLALAKTMSLLKPILGETYALGNWSLVILGPVCTVIGYWLANRVRGKDLPTIRNWRREKSSGMAE